MKANELMIGDWVEVNLSPSVHKSYFKAQIVVYNYDFDARPIPLTEDILRANGFKKEYDQDIILYTNEYGIEIEVGNDYKRFEDNRFYYYGFVHRLYFVHELQHILRLSGYKDLADNFKIEQDMKSVINWQTGTPTEFGLYLVVLEDNNKAKSVSTQHYVPESYHEQFPQLMAGWTGVNFTDFSKSYNIVAWQKIDKITIEN